jgi:hypothetical protein
MSPDLLHFVLTTARAQFDRLQRRGTSPKHGRRVLLTLDVRHGVFDHALGNAGRMKSPLAKRDYSPKLFVPRSYDDLPLQEQKEAGHGNRRREPNTDCYRSTLIIA